MIRQDPPSDGPSNMEADRLLLAGAEDGVSGGRVYSWVGVWVSLGRFQNPDRDLLTPETTPWVIRPTGGKAVLHGHDITVALAFPLNTLDADPRSIRSVYRAAIAPLVEALHACGLPATLADGTRHAERGQKTADCFAFTSPNDVVHEESGQKVCGCALRVTERAVLLQASIPHGQPLVAPSSVMREASPTQPAAVWRGDQLAKALRRSRVVGGLRADVS
ncbi:MAG: lipoyl protein ligase domain-containing protein [Fimbriimonas sp.]